MSSGDKIRSIMAINITANRSANNSQRLINRNSIIVLLSETVAKGDVILQTYFINEAT